MVHLPWPLLQQISPVSAVRGTFRTARHCTETAAHITTHTAERRAGRADARRPIPSGSAQGAAGVRPLRRPACCVRSLHSCLGDRAAASPAASAASPACAADRRRPAMAADRWRSPAPRPLRCAIGGVDASPAAERRRKCRRRRVSLTTRRCQCVSTSACQCVSPLPCHVFSCQDGRRRSLRQ